MKTYFMEIEGKETEVLPVTFAYTYGMKKELEAVMDIEISEDDFLSFMNDMINNNSENLENTFNEWKEWKEEQEE